MVSPLARRRARLDQQVIDPPADRRALRHLARMLHESALKMARYAPPTPESATPEELRVVAAYLLHTRAASRRSPAA